MRQWQHDNLTRKWVAMDVWIEDDTMFKHGERRAHRKGITVPVARKRPQRTPWSKTAERVQWQARRAARGGLPFMAWDGEGCNDDDGTMSYVLLGHTAGVDETSARYITDRRLPTIDLLEFIVDEGKRYPNYFHVSFGFGFDVDQILRDLPDRLIQELKDSNQIQWRKYRIFYIPRKMFAVSYMGRHKITIYDTLTFFQTNLINTANQYVPGDAMIETVAAGKAGRSSFDFSELDSIIIPYWIREGELMIRIMNALRHSLIGAGIHLEKWHGPGAIAEALIIRERLAAHITESRTETPDEVTEATAFAFFGGRFECFQFGDIPGPIYAYDIRSAYPNALTRTRALSGGYWVHNPPVVNPEGIYRVRNHGHKSQSTINMGPLPFRTDQGLVSYPFKCEGWYFGPEVLAAQLTGWDIEIIDGWSYERGEESCFQFLHEMYLQRADYKRAGNPAQLACKLGINSIYGKLAQLVGWDEENNLPPKFHHQWYAGMATSRTRAQLWHAMAQKPGTIIAVETDGIYCTEPLSLRLGEHLGEWELEQYDRMLYVQNGIYYASRNGEWEKARTRGISKGTVTVDDALAALPALRPLHSSQHRYGSLTGSLGSDKRFTWYDQTSEIEWGTSEKRTHDRLVCECANDRHRTLITTPVRGMSSPRLIPWLDGREYHYPDDDEDE